LEQDPQRIGWGATRCSQHGKDSVPSKEGVGGGVNLLRGQQFKIPTTHHLNRKYVECKKLKVIFREMPEFLFGFTLRKKHKQKQLKICLVASCLICPNDKANFLLLKIRLLSFQEQQLIS
jgi:hypothetical protein